MNEEQPLDNRCAAKIVVPTLANAINADAPHSHSSCRLTVNKNAVFLRRFVGRFIPEWIKRHIRNIQVSLHVFRNYYYDFSRFMTWSSVRMQEDQQKQLQTLITIEYHRLEKGLSLYAPRVGFGLESVKNLLSHLQSYRARFLIDENWMTALNVLCAYFDFNQAHRDDNSELYHQVLALQEGAAPTLRKWERGGTKLVSRQAIHRVAKLDLTPFFESRYSVRQFTDEQVNIQLIEQAMRMAQKTPSVCNRQTCKVHVYSQKNDKRQILELQNGNRGFGHLASHVLLVTSDLTGFVSAGERNQCWIDGGMFSMSLVYALHSLGLGTCCLNMSIERQVDKELRRIIHLNEAETIIMMIAVGHLPEQFRVAQSVRRKLEDILFIHTGEF
jgi:nitroreductase